MFLNDGKLNFEQAYFFRLTVFYKAIPEDFDGDEISKSLPFHFSLMIEIIPRIALYLENIVNRTFRPYSFAESNKGRCIVMEAGDIDNDGDIDLGLGSFGYFLAKNDTTGSSKTWLTESLSAILLENTIK